MWQEGLESPRSKDDAGHAGMTAPEGPINGQQQQQQQQHGRTFQHTRHRLHLMYRSSAHVGHVMSGQSLAIGPRMISHRSLCPANPIRVQYRLDMAWRGCGNPTSVGPPAATMSDNDRPPYHPYTLQISTREGWGGGRVYIQYTKVCTRDRHDKGTIEGARGGAQKTREPKEPAHTLAHTHTRTADKARRRRSGTDNGRWDRQSRQSRQIRLVGLARATSLAKSAGMSTRAATGQTPFPYLAAHRDAHGRPPVPNNVRAGLEQP